MLLGLAMVIATFLQKTWLFISMAVLLGVIVITLYVYSYVIWKKDPDKMPNNR